MGVIKRFIFILTWHKKLCVSCVNLKVIGNYSPCYGCRLGSNYKQE